MADSEQDSNAAPSRKPLIAFLLNSPLRGSGLEITRLDAPYEPPASVFAPEED